MWEKRVAITGPTAGIGRETALELAGRGAMLRLLCRNRTKGEALAREIRSLGAPPPVVIEMDMASLDSVRAAAAALLALDEPLDVLINNAGLINTRRRESRDGFEETLAVNHFAPFLLTGLALPALREAEAARIVNVASDAYRFVRGMRFEDMQAERNYRVFREYGRSKLANILFTRRLAGQLLKEGITVNCLHPGAVATSLGSQNPGLLSGVLPRLLRPFFRSPAEGAQTSLFLCSDPSVADTTGSYFVDCKPTALKAWALDDVAAERLWQYTEDCVGFAYKL
jgi:retinol dehydrogenase 12